MAEPVRTDETFNPHARGHQEDRVAYRAILLFTLGLTVVLVIVCTVLFLGMQVFAEEDQRRLAMQPELFIDEQGQYPGPRLLEAPGRELARMTAEVDRRLNAYGWVDRRDGVAHIPIDRAIQITAEQGLPARRPLDDDQPGDEP